jgi:hypothetical protein
MNKVVQQLHCNMIQTEKYKQRDFLLSNAKTPKKLLMLYLKGFKTVQLDQTVLIQALQEATPSLLSILKAGLLSNKLKKSSFLNCTWLILLAMRELKRLEPLGHY